VPRLPLTERTRLTGPVIVDGFSISGSGDLSRPPRALAVTLIYGRGRAPAQGWRPRNRPVINPDPVTGTAADGPRFTPEQAITLMTSAAVS
jgi:hypothetical protein